MTDKIPPGKMVRQLLQFAPHPNRSLFGVAGSVQYSRGDLLLVEKILASNPHWELIVECQAGTGLQTLYFATAMLIRGGDVRVFTTKLQGIPYRSYWLANVKVTEVAWTAGITSQESNAAVISGMASKPCLILIDGENRLEFVEAVRYSAAPRSIIMIHDWVRHKHAEFMDEATVLLAEARWHPSHEDLSNALTSRFGVWSNE